MALDMSNILYQLRLWDFRILERYGVETQGTQSLLVVAIVVDR
jgi:hypothetical protein